MEGDNLTQQAGGAASSTAQGPSSIKPGVDCGCLHQGETDEERFDHILTCGFYQQGLVALSEIEEAEFNGCLENLEIRELFLEFVKAMRRQENLSLPEYEVFRQAVDEVASRHLEEEKGVETSPDESVAPPAKKPKMTQVTLSEYSFFHEPRVERREAVRIVEDEPPALARPLVTVTDICNSLALYFYFLNKRVEYAKFVHQVSEHIRAELISNPEIPKPVKEQDTSKDGDNVEDKEKTKCEPEELLWEEKDVPKVRQFVAEIEHVEAMIAEQGCFRIEVGDFGLHVCFNNTPVIFPSGHASHMRFITFDVDGSHVETYDGKAAIESKQSYACLAERLKNLRFGQIFIMGTQWNKESVFNFRRHVQSPLNSCGHVSGNFVDLSSGSKFALYGMRGSADRLGQLQCRPGGVYIYMKPNDMSSVLDGPLARRDGNCVMCKMHRGCGLRKGIRDENIYIPPGISWDYMFEIFQKVGFPHCESRKNVMEAGTNFLECFCFGVVNCYGKGPVMSQMTVKMPNLTRLINKKFHLDAPYKELKDQKHNFTVCQVNRSVRCKLHVDGNNVGPSYICGFGDYSGGETWIYDGVGPVEMTVDEHLRGYNMPVGTVVKGTLHDIKHKWVHFSGRVPHCTMPFQGKRYALVLFIHNCTGRLKEEATIQQLDTLGFCVPPMGYDYSHVVTEEDLCHYDENPDVDDGAATATDSHTAADESEVEQISDADEEEAVQDGEYSAEAISSGEDVDTEACAADSPEKVETSDAGANIVTLQISEYVDAKANLEGNENLGANITESER